MCLKTVCVEDRRARSQVIPDMKKPVIGVTNNIPVQHRAHDGWLNKAQYCIILWEKDQSCGITDRWGIGLIIRGEAIGIKSDDTTYPIGEL